uniref:EGF-like domain-containing protein n=1 Tax=Strongyloides venezuelensis TaxID=75913 RepID=A0A0K0FQ29_STRVS
MEKLLKVLWILVVYLIHISSCDLKSDFIKQFKYLENDDLRDFFPRRHTINSNSKIIGVKCPRMNISISKVNLKNYKFKQVDIKIRGLPFKRPIMRYENKEGTTTEWHIFDIGEMKKRENISCGSMELSVNKSIKHGFDWFHDLKRTTEHKINIVKEGYLNVIHHIHGQKIYNKGFRERTIAFGKNSGYRVFDFETPNLYKGDKLVTFNDSNFYNEDIEFQEPIGIAKINHPPPSISIDNDPDISINYDNKECWLVESDLFPITFYIKLLYNGNTNQTRFFDYENVNVSYLRYSRDNKLEEIKNEILTPLSNNNRYFTTKELVIVKFQYNCDDCVDGGVNVVQNMLIGKNFDFEDKFLPSIGYYYDELHFNANCSMSNNNFTQLKTVSFKNEMVEVEALYEASDKSKGNFKLDNDVVIFTNKNSSGTLVCTYTYPFGKFKISQKYKSFKDTEMPSITYIHDQLFLKPNCSINQGQSIILKTVLFNNERVEFENLKDTSSGTKRHFKLNGTLVTFTGTNPNGKLSCIYKLTYGEFTTYELYKYFSNTNHPIIRYAFDQLIIRPNCSMEPERNVKLKTFLCNDESVEGEYFKKTDFKSKDNFTLEGGSIYFTGDNPKGKCTCVYMLSYGEFETFQEYHSIENITLPDIKYAQDQLNFHLNCSREENVYSKLKTIVFNDKKIEVEGFDDATLSQIGNIKATKKLLLYTVKNPEGKFSCVYKVPIGEIEKSQNYKSISNETHPVVEYSYKKLGYKANCSMHLNSFTHLRGIRFKDDSTTVVSLKRSRVGALGRLKLEKNFVVNTERNPNGTLFCLYDVPIGEVLVTKNFLTFETDDEENSSNKMGYAASMILGYIIALSMIIQNDICLNLSFFTVPDLRAHLFRGMPSTNGNNYYVSGIAPLSGCCNIDINGEVIKIPRQPKLLQNNHFAPEELLMAQRQPSPIDSLNENHGHYKRSHYSELLSMSDLARLLLYVHPMLSSTYIESQDVEIVKTCEMPVNNSTKITEKNRIQNAQKARDLLVNVAMNATKTTISSSKSRRNLRCYTRTFKKL